jgi:hypothetical protein
LIVYVLPFMLSLLGIIVYDIGKYRYISKIYLWGLIFTYLTLLIGLRYYVGGDTFFYHEYFRRLVDFDLFDFENSKSYQPFFLIFMKISKLIYSDFVIFQILHVLIINSVLFWFIRNNTRFIFSALFFCLLIFYINFSVEILRESLAVMIFLLNYKNLEQSKWLKYIVGVVISAMFHLSAIFLLILPFISFLKFNNYYLIFIIILTVLLTQIQPFLNLLALILSIQEKITFYSEYAPSINTTLLFFTAKFLIPVGFFFFAKYALKKSIMYESLMCLFGLIGIGTVFSTLIFSRLTNYMLPFYCISIAEIITPYLSLKKLVLGKVFMYFMIFCSIIIMGYTSFFWPTGYYTKWVPYMSIFSQEAADDAVIDRE